MADLEPGVVLSPSTVAAMERLSTSPRIAMTEQHKATPEQWEHVSSAAMKQLVPWATAACLLELRDRLAALEAAQRSDWRPVATETTYGDANAAAAAEQILRAPIVVQGTFEHGGETYRFKAKPERETAMDELRAASAEARPAGSLVDRTATDAELCQVHNDAADHAGSALRAVYDLGRQHGAAPIRSGPESPLVERVADAIAAQATSAGIVNDRPARAAILEVAGWLTENYASDMDGPPPHQMLRDEANQ